MNGNFEKNLNTDSPGNLMAKGSSGSNSYASKGSSGKEAYSGGSSVKVGYGSGNSFGYGGDALKGYGKGGLASLISGYGIKTYPTINENSRLSSWLSDYQKGLKGKICSDKETDRIIRELLREKPRYFEKTCKPDEKLTQCPFCEGEIGKCFCMN